MIETYSWQYSLGKTGTKSFATLIQFPIHISKRCNGTIAPKFSEIAQDFCFWMQTCTVYPCFTLRLFFKFFKLVFGPFCLRKTFEHLQKCFLMLHFKKRRANFARQNRIRKKAWKKNYSYVYIFTWHDMTLPVLLDKSITMIVKIYKYLAAIRIQFSFGQALRPGQFIVLMCLRVWMFACLSVPIYFLIHILGD